MINNVCFDIVSNPILLVAACFVERRQQRFCGPRHIGDLTQCRPQCHSRLRYKFRRTCLSRATVKVVVITEITKIVFLFVVPFDMVHPVPFSILTRFLYI